MKKDQIKRGTEGEGEGRGGRRKPGLKTKRSKWAVPGNKGKMRIERVPSGTHTANDENAQDGLKRRPDEH